MWPYPRVLAHRGAGRLAPENTLAAMRCGLDHGFHAVEFDVMLTRDYVPVLMHDPEFGRTIAGNGKIVDTTARQLKTMDVGRWFGPEFEGEKVPLLTEVLQFCQQHGIWMNIEIKPTPGMDVMTGQIVAEVTQTFYSGMMGRLVTPNLPLLSSFSIEALLAAKHAAPALRRAVLFDVVPPDWQEQMQKVKAVALHTNHQNLTLDLAAQIQNAGYGLFCYTVNEQDRARELLAWGVDAFCTDNLDVIRPDFANGHDTPVELVN